MADFEVTVDQFAPGFARLAENVDFKTTFPSVLLALNQIAILHLTKWRQFTQGEPIPGCPKVIQSRGDYTKSINMDVSKDDMKVVYSNGPWTQWFERGHGEIDLKPGLLNGPKARMGKKGPYNIVPFRHGIPNSLSSNNPMPADTYKYMTKQTNARDRLAPGSGASRITGKGPGIIQRASGAQDLKTNYQWGFRLPSSKGGTPKTKQTSAGDYTWKTGKHTGMVRMDASTKKARTSEYITFRVVSYKSDPASWIVPRADPIPIRQKVIETLTEQTQMLLKMALEVDLQ